MYSVDVYLLDWNQHRPLDKYDALEAALNGRYEYSFTIQTEASSAPAAAEIAWLRQGNNPTGDKVRRDRQSMSTGDVAVIMGVAYMCDRTGFTIVPMMAEALANRIEKSWDAWTAEPVA